MDKTIKPPQNQTDHIRPYFLRYTLIPVLPLSILTYFVLTQEFFLTRIDHFYLEIITVIISFIIASYAILRGYAFNDKFTLFLGLGFHAAGFIDILHAIISIASPDHTLLTSNFMAQTWIAGRVVMGIVILIAILKFGAGKIEEREDIIKRKTVVVYVVGLSAFAIAVAIVSLSVHFPLLDLEFEPNRPYEIPAAVIFSTALFFYYKRGLYTINDNFYKGILVALIIDIFGNVIFVSSSSDFDIAFNFAHILKIISMVVIILSLASSIIQYYQNKANLAVKLKKIDKEKDEFSIMITHELRTPLTPISGWCYALNNSHMLGNLNEKQKKAVSHIDRNANRMSSLIDNLMDAQKLELHEMKFNYKWTCIKSIFDRIQSNFEFVLKDKKIKLSCTSTNIDFKTDETRLIQVLSNLIQNAIDSTDSSEPKIEVVVKKEQNSIVFSVKDNGIGIPKEEQKNLFKKFYQADTSLTRKPGSSGLGLTICKGIIEGLGGRIWLESEKNKGSIFYFSIPMLPCESTRSGR